MRTPGISFHWENHRLKVEPDIASAHNINQGDKVTWEVAESALTAQLKKTARELDAINAAKRPPSAV